MSIFLLLIFLFFGGSVIGYGIELLYRRLVHKRWINPGFLVGPYLPIYGIGLCILSIIYYLFLPYNINAILEILLMGILLVLLELVVGLIFIKGAGIKLWDYSNETLNYKGIICPRFTLYWILIGAFYYYFIADKVSNAIIWYSNNISFSFVLGMFFATFIIDVCYSTNVIIKIRKYAKDNGMIIRYEEFKKYVKDRQDEIKKKYSFFFPFKQSKSLISYLEEYTDLGNTKTFRLFKLKRK